MDASITYGFLQVIPSEGISYTGGLLVVDQDGKPVEFHCTAPVPENRSQKIFYGETWQSHVYCDLIAKSLIESCNRKPELLFVEQVELVKLAGHIAAPVMLVSLSNDEPSTGSIEYPELQLDDLAVTVLTTDLGLIEFVKEACGRFTTSLAMNEPFERIRIAISEAQQVTRQADAA